MSSDLSQVRAYPRFPRLLIAESNFSTTESLINSFGDHRLDVEFDVCTSHPYAVRKLLATPYQLIISSASLAEMNDCRLLTHAQELQPFAPFVVAANAAERGVARRVLEQGAFDFLASPLDYEQTSGRSVWLCGTAS